MAALITPGACSGRQELDMVRVDPAVLSDPGRLGEWLTALDQVSWGGIGRNAAPGSELPADSPEPELAVGGPGGGASGPAAPMGEDGWVWSEAGWLRSMGTYTGAAFAANALETAARRATGGGGGGGGVRGRRAGTAAVGRVEHLDAVVGRLHAGLGQLEAAGQSALVRVAVGRWLRHELGKMAHSPSPVAVRAPRACVSACFAAPPVSLTCFCPPSPPPPPLPLLLLD